MADYSLTIYHLFPDLLNTCGDTGNVSVLEDRCRKRSIDVISKCVYSDKTADFSDADIIIFGGGGERESGLVSSFKDVGEKLSTYVQNGGVLLAVCSGYQLLGNFYEINGKKTEGFKILDTETKDTDEKYLGDLIIEANLGGRTVTLAGFANHGFKTDIKNLSPLGKVVSGRGDNGEFEGVIYKNTIGTYLGGPTLPKNPELADYLIEKALENKYEDFSAPLEKLDDKYEQLAKQFIADRNKK